MRILLTGVTGQVGGALAGPLSSLGTLIAAERSMLDLSRPETLEKTLDELRPDLIINPAAYTAVDLAESNADLAYTINAKAPQSLAQWARNNNIPLVHFSTDYVFDGSGSRPWKEDDPTGPLSIYGASKLAGEEAIRAIGGIHLIIRTSWVYASTGKNFLQSISKLAQKQATLRVVDDQFGAPTSARSIAKSFTAIVAVEPSKLQQRLASAGGLIHLANSGEASWHSFADAIVNGLSQRGIKLLVEKIAPISSDEFPTPAKRPKNSRLNIERLQKAFAIDLPEWRDALNIELDELSEKLI